VAAPATPIVWQHVALVRSAHVQSSRAQVDRHQVIRKRPLAVLEVTNSGPYFTPHMHDSMRLVRRARCALDTPNAQRGKHRERTVNHLLGGHGNDLRPHQIAQNQVLPPITYIDSIKHFVD
jgi:hypothetical protein